MGQVQTKGTKEPPGALTDALLELEQELNSISAQFKVRSALLQLVARKILSVPTYVLCWSLLRLNRMLVFTEPGTVAINKHSIH